MKSQDFGNNDDLLRLTVNIFILLANRDQSRQLKR